MSKLTDEQINTIAAPLSWVNMNYSEEQKKFARAIESAATDPLLQRIAHLEATASANYGRGHADAHSMLSERIAELERQLEEARKQMEAQKDEWLSWEAKRRELEADAGRWREWEQGRGLTVVVPTPTDDKPDRKVTVIYSPNPYSTYPAALRKAIDEAMQKDQS